MALKLGEPCGAAWPWSNGEISLESCIVKWTGVSSGGLVFGRCTASIVFRAGCAAPTVFVLQYLGVGFVCVGHY